MTDSSNAHPSGSSKPDPCPADGSALCLPCGLCCEGVFHTHVVVKPDELEHVRSLGLTVEACPDQLGFPLPCPLFRDRRCSIYGARRPRTCGDHRCDLLKKYLAGEIRLAEARPIIEQARALFSEVIAGLPAGYSFYQLRRELSAGWESGQGRFGSRAMRHRHATFLFTLAKLEMHARTHFGKP